MSGAGETASWKRTPGWVKLLLVVSLLGNAAVLGMFGGSMLKDQRPPVEPGLNRVQARILHMVPEPKREAARAILTARQDEIAAARAAQAAAQTEVLAALRADPFSAERLQAALAAQREASGQSWGIGYDQIAEIAAGLTAAERAEFAGAMEERYRRWQERRQRGR